MSCKTGQMSVRASVRC